MQSTAATSLSQYLPTSVQHSKIAKASSHKAAFPFVISTYILHLCSLDGPPGWLSWHGTFVLSMRSLLSLLGHIPSCLAWSTTFAQSESPSMPSDSSCSSKCPPGQEQQQEEEHEYQERLAVQQVQWLSQALLSQALAEYNEGSAEHYEQDQERQ